MSSRTLLLNVEDAEERRAALLEDGRLSLLWVEREDERSVVGNVYHGRVLHVERAIGAAFVDIGAERPAFLHVDDVATDPEPAEEVGDADPVSDDTRPPGPPRDIAELLEKGQSIVVQVLRDAYASKGASVTTNVSFPGRTVVLLPSLGRVGISRRIVDQEKRDALRAFLAEIQVPEGMGIVARTAAADADPDELRRELDELVEAHSATEVAAQTLPAVALLHEAADFVTRAIHELGARAPEGTTGTTRVIADTEGAVARVQRLAADFDGAESAELHTGDVPLFHAHGIEREVRSLSKPRVPLRGGGYLVIEGTEALWAVDVNSGRFRAGNDLEQTALATDLLAATECARQIRLRDLSGLIMVDFIDCRDQDHRDQVEQRFRDELAKDPGRLRTAEMSDFMVMEVTRRRMRAGPVLSGSSVCPTCNGRGRVRSPASEALAVVRDVRALAAEPDRDGGVVEIACAPQVRDELLRRSDALDAAVERGSGEVRFIDASHGRTAVQWLDG